MYIKQGYICFLTTHATVNITYKQCEICLYDVTDQSFCILIHLKNYQVIIMLMEIQQLY